MTINAIFPAILFFFKGVLFSVIHKKCFLHFERCFAPSFPPKPFFQKPLSVCHFLVFFCLPFQHSMFFVSSTPFDKILSFCFFGSIFVALFLFSFVLLGFQQVSWHPLLESTLLHFWSFGSSIFPVYMILTCFQVWCFLFFLVGFCLVFFWLLLSPFFSLLGFCFILLLFFVKLLWRLLFWFQIMT